MSLVAGSRIGPYDVISLLGAGGMGAVYRAHDSRLDRDVALEVLPAEVTGDETARARLVREARLASQLNHPHICRVYGFEEAAPSDPESRIPSASFHRDGVDRGAAAQRAAGRRSAAGG